MTARLTALVMVVALALAAGTDAGRAEPVRVRAAVHGDDTGRIVFNWDVPVTYQASIDGDYLEVRFDRVAEGDFQQVARALSSFIDSVLPGVDGRTVGFRLKGDYELVHFPTGTAVVVDLVRRAPAQPAPAEEDATETAPEPAAPEVASTDAASAPEPEVVGAAAPPEPKGEAPADVPAIGVRTGLHPDKTRVVFDWPEEVAYDYARDGGMVSLSFARPARIDVAPIAADPPRYIGDARSRTGSASAVVSFAVPAGARVEHFLAGPKVVLDIYPSGDGSEAGKLPPPGEAEAATVAADADQAGESASPADEGAAPDVLPDGTEMAADATADSQRVVAEAQAEAVETTPATGAGAPADAEEAEGQDDARQPVALTPDGQPETARAPAAAAGDVTVTAAPNEDEGFSVFFDWSEPVAAAVFRRGEALWIVFDKPQDIDVGPILTAAGPLVNEAIQVPHERATVLRLEVADGVDAEPRRDGLSWQFDLRPREATPTFPIEVVSEPDSPVGPQVFMPVPEPGSIVVTADPAIGDNLVVVPVVTLGYGVMHRYDLPQFRLLRSGQGIALKPKADSLRVRSLRDGVSITSTRTLYVSAVSAEDMASAQIDTDLSRILDLERWQGINARSFTSTRQQLERQVAFAQGPERQKSRLELARFLASHAFGAELLGVLQVIASEQPEIVEDAEFRLLRGIANFLLARYADARADLAAPSLNGIDEATFWRSATEVADGSAGPEDLRSLRTTAGVPQPYPRPLQVPMKLWVLEGAVQIGDGEQAGMLEDVVALEDLKPKDQARYDYLRGEILELAGDYDDAVLTWEDVMRSDDRWSRARAARARAERLLDMERLTPLQVIEELEKLRFAWRGDEFEFDLLRRLGTLYLQEGGYRQGLRTLRQAATHFRENEEASEVTQQMSDAFTDLYLNDMADRLPPVTAIALYEEFKELTPAGQLGDEMIRRLADRLVGVDLLDRAAKLLDGQVRFRLEGDQKARIGARLALVHILAREYQRAIDSLDESAVEGIPQDLAAQRRHLRARALMGLERIEAALALLEDDESLPADQLRTEIFWNDRKWPEAAQALRRLIADSGAQPGVPLTESQARYVLNQAVALTLSGNERALARLRRNYANAMMQTPFAEAFDLIATPKEYGLISYSSIESKVRLAENFRGFMDDYKSRLKDVGLSAIN